MLSKDLFLNVLIVLFPVLLYQIFYDRSAQKAIYRSWWFTGLLGGLSAVFCLHYPFVDGYHIFWDFRALPLVLTLLYAGYRAGALALLLEVAFRAYVGGDAAVYSIVFTLVYMCLPFGLKKRFAQGCPRRRLVLGSSLALAAYLMQLFVAALNLRLHTQLSLQIEAAEKICFLLLIGALQTMTMALAIWLIENLIATNKLRIEMHRAEKLGIISELAASIAHEVRNPLTVVRGFLQLVSHNADPKNKQYMDTAITELDRAVFIISDYLNFAKPQVETLAVFDASRELHDVVGLMTSFALLNGVQINPQLESGLWVRANPDKFKQAVINLLKNSIEASQSTGSVVHLRAYHDPQHIVIQVQDTGVGMTPDMLQRLGQPFYSTKEKGTGLGTMVTLRLIEAMDGELSFASTLGSGTEVTIRLPAVVLET
ncbi:sensor histidine kinase [Tumebacillus permanentifrigoris]|uniref:histidine kinase n=1 Tax=Tumebacillus permanentifrigoris TaxID=378543 RepID=A0A316E0X8_9BACL|nr:HAMP domain-containing sensor histidine kinase [Tumebacillus permanentifrigoris]PWK16470.1 two-component system sporulation sensor kinase B [Tumebacillus permanentifrigoris]